MTACGAGHRLAFAVRLAVMVSHVDLAVVSRYDGRFRQVLRISDPWYLSSTQRWRTGHSPGWVSVGGSVGSWCRLGIPGRSGRHDLVPTGRRCAQ